MTQKICQRWRAYCKAFDLPKPITLGLELHEELPFVKKRFYRPDGGDSRVLFLPRWLAEKGMDNVEPQDMLRCRNAELRREIIQILGMERICHALKAETVETVGNYSLLLLDLRDGRKRPYLKMANPSCPDVWHVEAVHPIIRTVQDALNYRRYGDAMIERLPVPEDIATGWQNRQARWNWEHNPMNNRIRAEYETSPLYPNPNDWQPQQLT